MQPAPSDTLVLKPLKAKKKKMKRKDRMKRLEAMGVMHLAKSEVSKGPGVGYNADGTPKKKAKKKMKRHMKGMSKSELNRQKIEKILEGQAR